jgi:tyrosine-protein phosphatase SIW14
MGGFAKRLFALVVVAALTCAGAGCSTPTPPTTTTLPPVLRPTDARPQRPLGDEYVPGIKNFGLVTADVWRGGHPSKAALDTLHQMGVRTVINLEEIEESTPGMHSEQFAVSGWHVTTMNTAEVVEAIRKCDKPVFIHCREGKDRTGLAVAAYRLSTGMSPDDAIAELHNFHVNPWWRRPIENRIHELAGK